MADKPKTRWCQFRLRTLLLVTALLCVPLAWVGVRLNDKRAAVAAIQRLGGTIQYNYGRISQYDAEGRQITGQIGTGQPPGPAWLRGLLGDNYFASVVRVVLPPQRVVLRSKYKRWMAIEPSVNEMRTMPTPPHYLPDGAVIDDDGLKVVAKLTDLEALCLFWTEIGDAGLANLSPLTRLRYLDFQHTNVTDAGLEQLHTFTGLNHLVLFGTQVTEGGVAELQKHLPNCKIRR